MALFQMYPKARERPSRIEGVTSGVHPSRRAHFKAAGINFLMLQMLFLGLFCYIFGALSQQGSNIHNLNIAFVDYDHGAIGASIRDAFAVLKDDNFPSLQEKTTSEYPSPAKLGNAVCMTEFWAAIYVTQGASQRLEEALRADVSTINYNRSDVLVYIWNEARFPTVADTSILRNIQMLSSVARTSYASINPTRTLQILNASNPTSISIFLDPWQLSSIDLQPTTQGPRLIYNTVVIILILIQEFFYLAVINGLYVQSKLYFHFPPNHIIIYRGLVSLSYTLCGSLCVTGAIWAFREHWEVNGDQFALTWAILWLFAHINFLWLDVFSIWLPGQFLPMALITWVIFNVSSIIVPFEVSPGFYRWGYAMPAHEVYLTLIDIWSKGCNPHLSYSLPTLFSLEVLGWSLSALGVYRRCHYAVIMEEEQQQALQDRRDPTVAFQKRHDQEMQKALEREPDIISDATERILERSTEREQLDEVIDRQDSQIQESKRRTSQACNFGPSFELVRLP
jgi:hypothetical protein